MEKYLTDNSKKLENIAKKFTATFKAVDGIKQAFVQLDASNTAQVKDLLTKLTGYFMELDDVLKKIEALKKNKAMAYYYSKKIEAQTNGEKFISAPIEKESELYVADERRIRNIFEGKVSACIEGIRTCRTILNQKTVTIDEEN